MPGQIRSPVGVPSGQLLGLDASQIQTITSGTTATIGAGIRLVLVDTSAGNFTLTRGALVVGHVCRIVKTSTDANTLSVAPASTEVITHAGLTASNATKVLAGSGLANRPQYEMTDTAADAVFIA